MYHLLFSCILLGPHFLGMAMSILLFLYLAGPYPCNISNVYLLSCSVLCIMCVSNLLSCSVLCIMCVCVWSCTLYDGLLWLCKWPSLIMSAFDLVVWVWAQGDCYRCIFMLYCVQDHRGVIVLIHVTWVTLVSPCMQHASTCLML